MNKCHSIRVFSLKVGKADSVFEILQYDSLTNACFCVRLQMQYEVRNTREREKSGYFSKNLHKNYEKLPRNRHPFSFFKLFPPRPSGWGGGGILALLPRNPQFGGERKPCYAYTLMFMQTYVCLPISRRTERCPCMLNLCFRKADATLHLDGNLQRVCVLSLAYLSRTTLDRQKRVGGDDKTYKSTNAHLGLIW